MWDSQHRQTRNLPCAGGACVNQRLAWVLRKQEGLLIPEARVKDIARVIWPRRAAVTPRRYRLRWRRRLLHNDMAAPHCVPGVLSSDARDCSPWQVAIVPATLGTLTCNYVTPFLREACTYESAGDWRWWRVSDVSWMPADDSIQGMGDEHHDLSRANQAVHQHLPCPPCRHQDRCPGNLLTVRCCVRGDGFSKRHEDTVDHRFPDTRKKQADPCYAIIAARL